MQPRNSCTMAHWSNRLQSLNSNQSKLRGRRLRVYSTSGGDMPIVLLGPAVMRIEGLDLPLPFRVETPNDFPSPRVGPCPVLVYLGASDARPMKGTYYA